jgi:hypothetical protein
MKATILFVLLSICLSSPQFGQSNAPCKENSLLVNGTAILKQIPEMLTASITVRVKGVKFNECQEKLVKAIGQATNMLVKNGIEKEIIHTNSLNVSERSEYLSEGRTKLGYEGSSSVNVEHLYSQEYAKKLLSALQNDSVNFLYNLDFTLSENQKCMLRQKAISLAISDAKEKAEAIAKSANLRLVKINSITFLDNNQGSYYESDLVQEGRVGPGYIAMSKSAGQTPAIDFNPKEIGIRKSVTIEWQIEEKN